LYIEIIEFVVTWKLVRSHLKWKSIEFERDERRDCSLGMQERGHEGQDEEDMKGFKLLQDSDRLLRSQVFLCPKLLQKIVKSLRKR